MPVVMPSQQGNWSQQAQSILGPEVDAGRLFGSGNSLSAGLGGGGHSLPLSLLLTLLNGKRGWMIQEVFSTSSPLLCFGCTGTLPRLPFSWGQSCLLSGFLHRCRAPSSPW